MLLKFVVHKHLQKDENGDCKPAYKRNPKNPENQAPELPEIVRLWPLLPGHIKDTIKTLVEAHKAQGSKRVGYIFYSRFPWSSRSSTSPVERSPGLSGARRGVKISQPVIRHDLPVSSST